MFATIEKYGLIAALVAIAVLSGALYIEHAAVKSAKADLIVATTERDSARQDKAVLLTASSAQDTARQTLSGLLATCNAKNEHIQTAADEAQARLVAADRARQRAVANLRAAEEKIYATNQQCSAWGAAPVCGAISGQLRDEWQQTRDASGTGPGDSPSAGNALRPDRSTPDLQAAAAAGADTGRRAEPGLPAVLLLGQAADRHAAHGVERAKAGVRPTGRDSDRVGEGGRYEYANGAAKASAGATVNAERADEVERWLTSLHTERHAGNVDAAALHIAALEFWKAIRALPDSAYTDLTVCKFCDTLALAFVAIRPT